MFSIVHPNGHCGFTCVSHPLAKNALGCIPIHIGMYWFSCLMVTSGVLLQRGPTMTALTAAAAMASAMVAEDGGGGRVDVGVRAM